MKNTLLAVIGLSPQIITETLYALNQINRPVHAIHAITTREGKDRILSQLFDGGRGPFHRFYPSAPSWHPNFSTSPGTPPP